MRYQTVTVRENCYQMGANRDFAAGGYFRNKRNRHYMKQTDSWRLENSILWTLALASCREPPCPAVSLGRLRPSSWDLGPGSNLVASQIASALKKLRKTPWLLQIPARKESYVTKRAEFGCEVNLTTSLYHQHLWPSLEPVVVILTLAHFISKRSQNRCCLLCCAVYLQLEFTLLFSHCVPRVHLLPSSLSLPLPQLLLLQHLISICFQFTLRLCKKV